MPCVHRGQQIVQIFGANHIVRDQFVYLVVGQVALLLPASTSFFMSSYLSSRAKGRPQILQFARAERVVRSEKVGKLGVARSCAPSTNFQSLPHKCWPVYYLPR